MFRLLRLTLHLARGVAVAGFVFPLLDDAGRQRRIRRWSARLLAILRIELRVSGMPPESGPALLVANHVSWLDIFLIDAVCPARFVAKAEVRTWPVIGWLCARVETIFIDRSRRHQTGRIGGQMQAALEAGQRVAVFPEGTTSLGAHVHHFHASLLNAAPTVAAPLWPVALRYRRPDGQLAEAAAYVGDTSFVESLWRIAGEPKLCAEVHFGTAIASVGRSRRELAHGARLAIVQQLGSASPAGDG